MDIDYVFPYVNNKDPVWIARYVETCSKKFRIPNCKSERYRNWGALKYKFRSIAANAPWIRTLYMIVETPSQVPSWINQDTVKIIYHRDIINGIYLPTYNSTTIEMFINKIEGLSEYFLYGNDDFYINAPTSQSDFYDESGLPKLKFSRHSRKNARNQYRIVVRNCNDTAAKLANVLPDSKAYLKPLHQITPMRLSTLNEVHELMEDKILSSITTWRSEVNYNQYLYTFYQYYKGESVESDISNKYLSFDDNISSSEMAEYIRSNDYKLLCINDTGSFEVEHTNKLRDAFLSKYNTKCKYEL